MVMRIGLAALALYYLVIGIWMIVDPGSFYSEVGPFGPRNDHYIRDNATFHIALGIGAIVAYGRAAWRLPLLAIVALQFWLHAINHLVDIDEADPKWLGTADFISLVLGALLVTWLAREAARDR